MKGHTWRQGGSKSEPQLLPEPGIKWVLLPCKNILSRSLQPRECLLFSPRPCRWLSPRQLKITARAAQTLAVTLFIRSMLSKPTGVLQKVSKNFAVKI